MDRRIDFLIIGAQKAGTTALFEFLGAHPEIFMPGAKEVHFFIRDEFYLQGERYLAPLYASVTDEALVGAADVEIMYFPGSAERIHAYNPDMRLLAVLRDPVDRAYSGYWFARRLGFEEADTFEEALGREDLRARGGYSERSKLTYVGHGLYAEQLERFLRLFGRDRLWVVLSEDLREQPRETLEATLGWLGVRPEVDSIDYERRVNVAGLPRSMLLQKLLRADDSRVKGLLRRAIPHKLRHFIRRRLRAPLIERNIRPISYPPMCAETRVRLRQHFAPHNERLARLLRLDLSRWDGAPPP